MIMSTVAPEKWHKRGVEKVITSFSFFTSLKYKKKMC